MGRVLVVDDDTDVRTALTMLLEDDGHSVVGLDDGLKVLDIISEHGVDVILLDLSMPKVDGFEVLSMLMLDPRSAGIPVIVVSARGRPEDKAQAMALGASDYVNKPWGEGVVEFRVRMALGSRYCRPARGACALTAVRLSSARLRCSAHIARPIAPEAVTGSSPFMSIGRCSSSACFSSRRRTAFSLGQLKVAMARRENSRPPPRQPVSASK